MCPVLDCNSNLSWHFFDLLFQLSICKVRSAADGPLEQQEGCSISGCWKLTPTNSHPAAKTLHFAVIFEPCTSVTPLGWEQAACGGWCCRACRAGDVQQSGFLSLSPAPEGLCQQGSALKGRIRPCHAAVLGKSEQRFFQKAASSHMDSPLCSMGLRGSLLLLSW